MHIRKNIGIIKYGPRASKNSLVKKLQTGGAASVVSGYEWREDPYELMLMKQEGAGLSGTNKSKSSSRSGSSGLTKDPKLGAFDVLEGGLDGTRKALRTEYKKIQDEYMENVSNNPRDWISSLDGQRAFNHVVTVGQEFQQILNSEKDQFDDAKGKLNESDSEALAISNNKNMMVQDVRTGKYAFIHLKDYLNNIEIYQPQRLKDFMYWKQNVDTSGAQGNTGIINEFMANNAVSPEEVSKQYVAPHINAISYIEDNGFIVRNNKSSGEVINTDSSIARSKNWSNTIAAAMNGEMPKDVSEKTRTDIMAALRVVYNDILGSTTDGGSRLKSSLYSEVLSNTRHRNKLAALDTPEAKQAYLEQQANLALVNKVYTKGASTTTSSSSSQSSGGNKGKANVLVGAMNRMSNGNLINTYTVGSDFKTGKDKDKKRVVDVSVPKVDLGNTVDLNLATDKASIDKNGIKQNIVGSNDFMATYGNGEIYTENGVRLATALSPDEANSFQQDNMRIARGAKTELVWVMTDAEGNMTMHEGRRIAEQKLKNRESFIIAYNKFIGGKNGAEPITVAAEDILPGSSDEKISKAHNLFVMWAKASEDADAIGEAFGKTPSKEMKARYNMAKAARDMRIETLTMLSTLSTKKLTPMIKLPVLVDTDGPVDIYDMSEKRAKATGYGHNMVKDKATSADMDYMTNLNDVDNFNIFSDWSRRSWWPISDNIYKMNIFMPVQDLGGIAAKMGTDVSKISNFNNIDNASNVAANAANAITNPGNAQAVTAFITE